MSAQQIENDKSYEDCEDSGRGGETCNIGGHMASSPDESVIDFLGNFNGRRDSLSVVDNFQDSASDILSSETRRNSSNSHIKSGAIELAREENRAVNAVRITLLILLVALAVAVSYSVYVVVGNQEENAFKLGFEDQAGKIVDSFRSNADRRLGALQAFSQLITTYAVSSNSTFPFMTLPDFERNAAYTLKLSDVVALLTFPIVETEDRSAWEDYSVANQGWLSEGLAVQDEVLGALKQDQETVDMLTGQFEKGQVLSEDEQIQTNEQQSIPPRIYKIEPGTTISAPETGPGPYAPIWQFSPAIPVNVLINFNSFTYPVRARQLSMLYQNPRMLLSSAADFRDEDPLTANRKSVMNLFLDRWKNGTYDYEAGPVSDVYLPIYDHNGPNRTMKSVLTAYVYWQSYFTNILPEDAKGILVTLQNTCNQSFSYEITGRDVSYLGKGDFHDSRYDHLMVETGFGAVLGTKSFRENFSSNETSSECFYNVKIYPSSATEDQYTTSMPLIFALALTGVFAFTSAVFLLYDACVSKRHKIVKTTAVRSTTVVQSLFPESVHERLYDATKNKTVQFDLDESQCFSSVDQLQNMAASGIPPSELGLNMGFLSPVKAGLDPSVSDPIADLYPNCTVLFADLAGFTKWSSQRQPIDVFRLLETIYGALDKMANRRRIFKVETIGDCYVAVTGLPKPQKDHAIRMCKFAAESTEKMNQVLHSLVPQLGDDTMLLSMRCGLHSGPVTAGILRGDKARFQLFGDTVNTAARMESTGHPGKIHVSEDTAIELMKSGKQGWLTRREDAVTPKGKGIMTTYWVTPSTESAATSVASSSLFGLGGTAYTCNGEGYGGNEENRSIPPFATLSSTNSATSESEGDL